MSVTNQHKFQTSTIVATICQNIALGQGVCFGRPVWCRGASRYVGGCWEFPYLKIQKLQNSHFIFYRCAIHIQDLEEHFAGIFIIARCPSSIFNFPKFKNSKFQNCKISKKSQINKSKFQSSKIFLILATVN